MVTHKMVFGDLQRLNGQACKESNAREPSDTEFLAGIVPLQLTEYVNGNIQHLTVGLLLTCKNVTSLERSLDSLYECTIHYQAHRPGVIFLLWSSSKIHQHHSDICLHIIEKAKNV